MNAKYACFARDNWLGKVVQFTKTKRLKLIPHWDFYNEDYASITSKNRQIVISGNMYNKEPLMYELGISITLSIMQKDIFSRIL